MGARDWTKLSKAFPPVGVPVVIITASGYAKTATWNGEFWRSSQPGGGTITHWRPATPAKGESNG